MTDDDLAAQRQRAHADTFAQLLREYQYGDARARNAIVSLVYADLRSLARRHLRGQRWHDAVDTTVLVHESYLRLVGPSAQNVRDRSHFMRLASRIMRQLLCDYARRRLFEHERFMQLQPDTDDREPAAQIIDEARNIARLNDALDALVKVNERQVRVVECRFFAGLSEIETALALNLSLRTVQREWGRARVWLAEHVAE